MRIVFGIVGLVALAWAGTAAAEDWKVYTFADQAFSIESPVPLTKGSGFYQAGIAGHLPTATYRGELDKIRYEVSIVDISNRPAEAVNLYEEMEYITELGGKEIGNDEVGIEPGKLRHYGRELVLQLKDGSLERIVLLYHKGKIFRTIATVLPGGDKESIYPERFCDSLIVDLDPSFRERDANPDNFEVGKLPPRPNP
jgi:hypothetical protein